MNFGQYFKKLRKSKNITQKQIADAIGKTTMLISGIETNKNSPFSDDDLKKVSDYMKLSEDECKELLIQAYRAKGKLPPHITDYIGQHKSVYSLLEILAEKQMNDISVEEITKYAEGMEE